MAASPWTLVCPAGPPSDVLDLPYHEGDTAALCRSSGPLGPTVICHTSPGPGLCPPHLGSPPPGLRICSSRPTAAGCTSASSPASPTPGRPFLSYPGSAASDVHMPCCSSSQKGLSRTSGTRHRSWGDTGLSGLCDPGVPALEGVRLSGCTADRVHGSPTQVWPSALGPSTGLRLRGPRLQGRHSRWTELRLGLQREDTQLCPQRRGWGTAASETSELVALVSLGPKVGLGALT